MMQAEKAYKVRDTHFPLRIFGMIFGSLLLIGGFHTQIVVMFDNCDSRLFAGYMKEYEGGPPALLPESWPAPENAEERKNAGGMKKQLQSF